MKTSIVQAAGWLIIGLTVLPLIPAVAGLQPSSTAERLEWLLATHDVRNAIHAPLAPHADSRRADSRDCSHDEAERSR